MAVSRFEIMLRRPLAGGASFTSHHRGTSPAGEVGPYEELKGRLHFAIDPTHPANRRITDVELAPRNAAGRVEWSADVSILLPVDRAKCSGRVMLDVVNRGNTVAVPNFNRATRPLFGAGLGSEPADRRRRRLPDAARLRRDLVRLAGRRAGDSRPLPDAPARGARLRRASPSAAASTRSFSPRRPSRTSCSRTAATFPTPPPTSRRPAPS